MGSESERVGKDQSIGFIGLGSMGSVMAANLLRAGFKLTVHNRSPERATPLVEQGATAADSPAGVAGRGGVVVSILSDDRAVEAVADDRLIEALGPGGLHISMSTIAPSTSEKLAEHHARAGVAYVAAPVFGRPAAAAAAKLWVCTSGPAAAKERARPIFDAVGQGVHDFGETVGAANVVKLAGNFLLTSAVEAMAEASAFAEKSGIPRAALLNMLIPSLFNCPIYVNYGKMVMEANYDQVGFPPSLLLKDVRLVLQTAEETRTPLPLAGLLRDRLLMTLAKGRDNLDSAAFALGAAEDAGLTWFPREEASKR